MHVDIESGAGAFCRASRHTVVVRNIISNKICFNTGKSLALSPSILVAH